VIRTVHSRIGANLLIRVPDSYVLVPDRSVGVESAIPDQVARRCALVWFQTYGSDPPMDAERALAAALGREATGEERRAITRVETVAGEWQRHLLGARDPPPVFGLAELDPASALCGSGEA
jgi:hypothetical protein